AHRSARSVPRPVAALSSCALHAVLAETSGAIQRGAASCPPLPANVTANPSLGDKGSRKAGEGVPRRVEVHDIRRSRDFDRCERSTPAAILTTWQSPTRVD